MKQIWANSGLIFVGIKQVTTLVISLTFSVRVVGVGGEFKGDVAQIVIVKFKNPSIFLKSLVEFINF